MTYDALRLISHNGLFSIKSSKPFQQQKPRGLVKPKLGSMQKEPLTSMGS